MQLSKLLISVAAASLIGFGVAVAADEAKPDQAAPVAAEKTAKAPKLEKPYSELTDLTDDQKAKLVSIHKETLDAVRALQAKEKADSLEVLTDDQKKELATITAKLEAERKAEAEARRAKMAEEKAEQDKLKAENLPTTQPAKP